MTTTPTQEQIARAIWSIRREDEDRCDMELEDMGKSHSVWREAAAVVSALAASEARDVGELTDEQIIERCKAAGIQWLPPEPEYEEDGTEVGFPGGFDLTGMNEMRALLATRASEAAPAQSAWVSVDDHMPGAGKPVLFSFLNALGNRRTARGYHAPRHTLSANDWEDPDDADTDEQENYWVPEGWWEDPVEIEGMALVRQPVTHWMPLPASPDALTSQIVPSGEAAPVAVGGGASETASVLRLCVRELRGG